MARKRIISTRIETVDQQQEIDLIARRQRVFGILVNEIMLNDNLDWHEAKRKLIKELKYFGLKHKLSNLKSA